MQNQNLDLKYCVFAWKLANVLLPPLFSSMWKSLTGNNVLILQIHDRPACWNSGIDCWFDLTYVLKDGTVLALQRGTQNLLIFAYCTKAFVP